MLICPDCAATNLDVTAAHGHGAELRWHGRCLDCGREWDFDD
jgi:hypothetical protein